MCGIIGYIGAKDVLPILIDGLRRLEYRGYDSAGVAVVANGAIELRRSAGKLSRLEDVLATQPLQGDYGIGHTRWATHGRPTEENAHPHRDCTGRIVVVHNGIIENYLDLKRQLQQEGHTLRHRDRHRDRRAPGRARESGRRARERGPARAALHARPVRAGADLGRRPGQDRHRPQRPADRRRARRQRVLRRLRHPRGPQPHPRRGVPRRRGDGGHHAVRRGVHRLLGPRGLEEEHPRGLGSGDGREGRLQALHAQGDLRAAVGGARDGARAGRRSRPARSSSRRSRFPTPSCGRSTASSSSPAGRRGTRRWSASS